MQVIIFIFYLILSYALILQAKVQKPSQYLNAKSISTLSAADLNDFSKLNKAPAHHSISFTSLVINVIADLCPHGMLPLAYGFAQGGPNGVIPAVVLVLLFGAMSAYTMTSYAFMGYSTGSDTIAEIWSKVISPKSKWIVDASIFALCYGCCVFYSAFMGDIFGALSNVIGLKGIFGKRATALLALSGGVLLPLCLQSDLSALQVSSLIGVFGIIYTLAFQVLRLFDGTYSNLSPMLEAIRPSLRPSFPSPLFNLFTMNKGTLVLANMFCVAFLAHYNSITYFKELNSTPNKYAKAIATGFSVSTLVFTTMMFVGYRLFGSAALPLILNNYPRTQDILATGARAATGAAIMFAYPLMFAGLKSAMFSLLDTYQPTQPSWSKPVAISAVLASITAIAMKCGEEDVSVVLGIVGSLLGCFVAYVLPGYLRLALMRQRARAGLKNNKAEVNINHLLIIAGVVFGVLGVWVTIDEAASAVHHGH